MGDNPEEVSVEDMIEGDEDTPPPQSIEGVE